jgi:dienelactone hydrolase
MALGTQALPGVRGLINFAGGLRDDSDNCGWRSALVTAFAEYGAQNKIPSLWMYGENDSLFGPELVARMHDAFEQAGGRAVWSSTPVQARFARHAGQPRRPEGLAGRHHALPRQHRHADQGRQQGAAAADAAGDQFRQGLDDADAVPFLSENGKRAYANTSPR